MMDYNIQDLAARVADQPEFSKKWRIKCGSDYLRSQDFTGEDVLKITRLAALYGISQVATINLDVASEMYKRLKAEDLNISCGKARSKNAEAEAMQLEILFLNKRIFLGKTLERLNGSQFGNRQHYGTFFHELLHLIGMDNQKMKIHNTIGNAANDTVYSCSEFAFFNPQYTWVGTKHRSCMVCALATLNKKKIVVDWNDSEKFNQADQVCAPYKGT